MFTGPAQIEETSRASSNTLPQKQARNGVGMVWYRADYELRALRKCKTVTNKLMRLLSQVSEVMEFCALSRELDRWIERERVLLRIRLPGSEPPGAVKDVPKQPVVYTDIAPSAAHVMTEQPVPVPPSSPVTPPSPRDSGLPK